MQMAELLETSKRRLREITGLRVETVTRVCPGVEGTVIAAELLEMSRIPPSTDVLAEYEVLLDGNGELLRLERKRSRLRGEPVATATALV